MTDYDIHRPSFSGTTKTEWEFPTGGNFDTSDLSTVADRFLLSASGFDDPDEFDDLALPVVNSQGYLSLNGLWAAQRGPYSVERIDDIDEETKAAVRDLIDDLGKENFEEFRDVTVTKPEWEETTGAGPANPLDGIVNNVLGPSQPSYSPQSATIGLVFLAIVAIALNRR
jgi:hypothetical protein